MPLAGYLGSVWSGYPVKFFGVTLPAWAREERALKDAHERRPPRDELGAAGGDRCCTSPARCKHALSTRDGLLARMGIGPPAAERRSTLATPSPRDALLQRRVDCRRDCLFSRAMSSAVLPRLSFEVGARAGVEQRAHRLGAAVAGRPHQRGQVVA